MPSGIEILIESGAHVEGLTVQEKPPIGRGQLAKSKAACAPAWRSGCIEMQGVEIRMIAVPQHRPGHVRFCPAPSCHPRKGRAAPRLRHRGRTESL